MSSVTVSRAADALGEPVDLSRPPLVIDAASGRPVAGTAANGRMPWRAPLARALLTSGFGTRTHPILGGRRAHRGVDFAAPFGTPVAATSDGTVSMADWSGGYGLLVAVEHGSGLETRYGHMSRLNVAPGQRVRAGDIIGYVGSTGLSTGPHLHYEVRLNGQAMDPLVPRKGK